MSASARSVPRSAITPSDGDLDQVEEEETVEVVLLDDECDKSR